MLKASRSHNAIDRPETKFVYSRPTEKMKLRTYVVDTFGPYPMFEAALIAGINQTDAGKPEPLSQNFEP